MKLKAKNIRGRKKGDILEVERKDYKEKTDVSVKFRPNLWRQITQTVILCHFNL